MGYSEKAAAKMLFFLLCSVPFLEGKRQPFRGEGLGGGGGCTERVWACYGLPCLVVKGIKNASPTYRVQMTGVFLINMLLQAFESYI